MPPFHVACPFTCKPVCHCAHGPGGAAAPLRDARGAPVSAAQLSRNAQALWALCQAPGTAFDDADGVLVALPGLPRAPPPQRDASGQPALQAASAAARQRVADAENAVSAAQAALERAERVAAPKKAPPPPAAAPSLPAPPSLWDAGGDSLLFGPLDDDLLLGGDDLSLPGVPLQPAVPRRRLLQWAEVGGMTGALLEVFWECPPGGAPPTGWYTARVVKMSQRGQTQLHYQQTNAVETLEPNDLQALVRRGLIAVLEPPPPGAGAPPDEAGAKRKR